MSECEIYAGPWSAIAAIAAEADVLLCDPPYREHVHAAATSGGRGRGIRHRDLGFASLTSELRAEVAAAANAVKRWSLIYSDVETPHLWREAVAAEYIRQIPWIRWSMPNLQGDRPAQGYEVVSIFHRKGRKSWNGRGELLALEHAGEAYPDVAALWHKCLRGEGKYKAEKPLDQALDLVSWFSDPGELVIDPTCGVGTFGVACALLGRRFVGAEIIPDVAARASERVTAAERGVLSARDRERFDRWANSVVDEDTSRFTAPSQARGARRKSDLLHAAELIP